VLFKRSPRGRKPKDQAGGVFKTAIDRNNQGVTINAFWRHSRVKQYLKDGRALRIETVVNSPVDSGIGKRLDNLPALRAAGQRIPRSPRCRAARWAGLAGRAARRPSDLLQAEPRDPAMILTWQLRVTPGGTTLRLQIDEMEGSSDDDSEDIWLLARAALRAGSSRRTAEPGSRALAATAITVALAEGSVSRSRDTSQRGNERSVPYGKADGSAHGTGPSRCLCALPRPRPRPICRCSPSST
jgi:hypothetical protein